jgi:hypothetical protein
MKHGRNIESEQNVRLRIIELLELISSPKDQIEYQFNVPHVYVPTEIIEQWHDDVDSGNRERYRSDIYSAEELSAIWEFDSVWDKTADELDSSLTMEQMIESGPWKNMIRAAENALSTFRKSDQQGEG